MSEVERISNDHLSTVFRCPVTGSVLSSDRDQLVTHDERFRYPVRDGVPCFLAGKPIEDDETRRELTELNRFASQQGWRGALNEVYGTEADIIKYVTTESRAAFLDLLELDETKSVLEIGPGLGQFSGVTAKRSKHLYGLEVVEGQAHFAAARCRQEGAHNTTFACGGDDCRLPFPDQCMDIVLLNLVFEWCWTRNEQESPESAQRRLLAEMHRVLKPGGSLYLTTKNRFALRYLLGKPDEHSFGMRFGNALPRWLHRRALRIKGHARPAGLLHSHNALRSMLKDEGYADIRSFWAAPEMRYPTHFAPTDSASIRAARSRTDFVQGNSRSTKWIMPRVPSAMVKHVMPGLTFIAHKG